MIKDKYNYRNFIDAYIMLVKCRNLQTQSQQFEYYLRLYSALETFFGIDISYFGIGIYKINGVNSFDTIFESRDFEFGNIYILNKLIDEYNLVDDILYGIPIYTVDLPKELYRIFNSTYVKNTTERKALLLNMIYCLCEDIFGKRSGTVTHRELFAINPDLAKYEFELSSILKSIYKENTVKNSDGWSAFYYIDELNKCGYSGPLPILDETITIGSCQINCVPLGGIAYGIRPSN